GRSHANTVTHGHEDRSPPRRTTPSWSPPNRASSAPEGEGGRAMIASLCFDPLDLYVAVRSDPGLARVPLVSVEEQRVTHANAPARRHGITPGMRLDGARMRVEGLEVVSHTEPDLQHAWEELLRELNQ